MKIESIELNYPNRSSYSQKSDVYSNNEINKSDPSSNMVKSREEETGLPSYKELLRRKEMDDGSISVSEKAIIEAIERANKAVQLVDTSFEFSIHEKTRQIMVKVLNRETKEVIREIPPEKILDMVAKIWEMAGIIVDERR